MIRRRTLVIIGILLLAVMGFIFFMSSRDVDQSLDDSIGFDRVLAHWLVEGFDEMTQAQQFEAAVQFDEPIRHVAHFSEFCAMGLLLGLLLSALGQPGWIAFAAGAVYGVLDEIHQIFVSGRGCQLSDMCFDAGGVLLGVLIASLLLRLIGRRPRRPARSEGPDPAP